MKCAAQEYLHPPKIAKVEEEENEGREDEAREGENGEDKGEKQVHFISRKIGNTVSQYLDGERCYKECHRFLFSFQ
jgi:hypothetical protein